MVQWRYYNVQYGDIQVRATIGHGWPAIWMEGSNCQASNVTSPDNIGTCNWDAAGSGEIDIVEGQSISGGNTSTSGTNNVLHANIFETGVTGPNCVFSTSISDPTINFHVYELQWGTTGVKWFVDGTQVCSTSSTIADHLFLLINSAVGGTFGGNPTGYTYPYSSSVDWVKVCGGDGVTCSNGIASGMPTNATFWDDFTSTSAYGISIPSGHPRLLAASQAQMNQALAWFATHPFTPSPSPDGQTEGLQYALHYLVSGTPSDCSNLYTLVTGQDSNIAACSNTGSAGCDPYRWYGEDYALAYDVCYNQLSSSQLSHLLTNMNTWVPGNNGQGWGGVGSSMSNYYWGDERTSAEWGIASYLEQPSTADPFLKNAVQTRYENDFIPATATANQAIGGVFEEGNEYGPYGGFYNFAIQQPAINTLGLNLTTFNSNTFWPGWGYWLLYSTFPTPTVGTLRNGPDMFPFSDTQTWQNGAPATVQYIGDIVVQLAQVFNGTNEGQYLRQWIANYSPTVNVTSQATDPGGTASVYNLLPLDYYAAGYHLALGRSDWTNNATVFQLQMGDNYSINHNHADWGTFQIYRKGKWLTRESAGYGNTIQCFGGGSSGCDTSTFIAHNGPVINGLGGVAVTGGTSGQAWNGPPQVTRIESQPGYFFASNTLQTGGGTGQGVYRNEIAQPGHPERENTSAVSIVRDTIFIRDIATTVILDRLQADTSARPKTFLIKCETAFVSVDSSHIQCQPGSSQQLAVTTLLPSAPSYTFVTENEKNGSNPVPALTQFRAEITDSSPSAALSYMLHVLQAMDTTGTLLSPSIVDNGTTWTITLDANHSLTLAKGAVSTGGSVTISGTTTPFTTSAQTLTISTTGLTWSSSSGGTPIASFSPTSLTFGAVRLLQSSTSSPVTLTNTGTAAMSISSISMTGTNPGDFTQTNNCPASLNINASCTINVTFSPLGPSTRSASLSVSSNTATSPDSIPLTGTGLVSVITGTGSISGRSSITVHP
jgi:hypothetical protein